MLPRVISKFLTPLPPRIHPVLPLPWSYIPLIEIFLTSLSFLLRGFLQVFQRTSWGGIFQELAELVLWLFWSFSPPPLLLFLPIEASSFPGYWFQKVVLLRPELLLIPNIIERQVLSFWKFYWNIQWKHLVLRKCINLEQEMFGRNTCPIPMLLSNCRRLRFLQVVLNPS